MKKNINPTPIVLCGLLVVAALSRIIPHPYNFAPCGALGLFGAAYFSRKWVAILLPLLSLLLSDIVLMNTVYANTGSSLFYDGFLWVYGTTALCTIIGFITLNKITVFRVLGSAILASILFFALTNFGYFAGTTVYPHNFSGLMLCYGAALPFFGGTIFGNLFYSAVMFGGFELAKYKFPVLSTGHQPQPLAV